MVNYSLLSLKHFGSRHGLKNAKDFSKRKKIVETEPDLYFQCSAQSAKLATNGNYGLETMLLLPQLETSNIKGHNI